MNLIWHQLKKDIRHARVLLGLWLFVAALRFAMVAANVNPADTAWQTSLFLLSMITGLLGSLMVMILVTLVIQQEPLVGTTAFWMTRPISRGTLLAEKSLFLLGLILVPLFIQTVVMLVNGVALRDTAIAASEFALGQASWMLIVAILAVLTPNFGRFVIVGSIYFVISYLCLFVFQMMRLFFNPTSLTQMSPSLTASRGLISDLILIALGTAAVLCQYLHRRYRLSIVLGIVALLGSSIVGQYWPWNFLKPAPQYVHDPVFRPAEIQVKLNGTINANDESTLRGGEPNKQITATFLTPGLPPGYVLKPVKFDAVLQTVAGERIPLLPINNNISFGFNTDGAAVQQALNGIPVANSSPLFTNWQLFSVSATTYQRYAHVPAKFSAQIQLLASKYVVTSEMSLAKGAQFRHGSYRETVTDVLHQADGIEVILQVQDVRLAYALRPDQDMSAYDNRGSAVYVLVNRKRNQAVLQKQNLFNFSPFSQQEALTHQPRRIGFGPENNRSQNSLLPDLDDAWLHDAVLVRLELEPVAEFTKQMTIPDFRLDGRFNVPGQRWEVRAPDLDTLTKITLPDHADRQQTHDYIASILIASLSLMGHVDEHDPQESMLEKVGAQNVDLLIAAAHDSHNYYLNHAIDHLAQPDQKAMVIADLPANPDLVTTVVDHGWQADAKDVLMAGLEANSSGIHAIRVGSPLFSYLPPDWIRAIISLKDPTTYAALEKYFTVRPNPWLAQLLKPLPGFDSAGALDQAWKSAQADSNGWRLRDLLPAAADAGKPDVPAVLIRLLGKSIDPYSVQVARKVTHQSTLAVGKTDDELIAWLKANEANLAFDPVTKK